MVMPWLVCTVNHSFDYFAPAHRGGEMEVSVPAASPPHYKKPLSAAKSALCHTLSYLNKHEFYGAVGFKRNFNDLISQYVRPCAYTAMQDPTLKKG